MSFSEEAVFSRPICLEVFISPVSTTCGHNFCRTCITKFWVEQDRYKCPVCNELFHTRPALWVNTFISGMAAEFTRFVRRKVPCVKPGDVPCEVCTGTKLKAVKSYLNCQTSCSPGASSESRRTEETSAGRAYGSSGGQAVYDTLSTPGALLPD